MIDYPIELTYQFPLSQTRYTGTILIQLIISNGSSINVPVDKETIIKYVDIAFENIKKNFT
jgi:hypothetical protein